MRSLSTLATLLLGLAVVFWAPAAKADCPHNNDDTHQHCVSGTPSTSNEFRFVGFTDEAFNGLDDTINGGQGMLAMHALMRKIPLMSLRQILPVDHSCVHYCELKALEICNILNHKGVTKKKCIDRSFDLCLSMIRYGDC